MMDYEAWLVDLDGTLYRPTPVKLAMAVELLVLSPGSVNALRRFRREHEHIRETGEGDGDPFRRQIEGTAAALGRDPAELRALVECWMVQRPGRWLGRFRRDALLSEIRSYRERGGKTAVVSDYPARSKLRALGVVDLFDTVVAAGEPGGPPRLKPDPAGYLLAAERLDVSPSRCLVIGDRDDADGAAARSANMAFRKIA